MISLIEAHSLSKFIETESKIMVTRDWEEEVVGSYCSMRTEFQFWMMKKFEMDDIDGWTSLCMYVRPLNYTLTNDLNGKFHGMYILPK